MQKLSRAPRIARFKFQTARLRSGSARQANAARRACPVRAKARIIARILYGADGNDRLRGASVAVAECPLHANSDAQQNVIA
jgi:hypothetical protein